MALRFIHFIIANGFCCSFVLMRTRPRIFKTWQHCCPGLSIPDGAAIRFLIMSERACSHLCAHAHYVKDSSSNGMTSAYAYCPQNPRYCSSTCAQRQQLKNPGEIAEPMYLRIVSRILYEISTY